MTIFFLALRNVILQWKRYMLMFAAILMGFSLVILVHAITFGALETVKTKAARYFSGHISITGYIEGKQLINNPKEIINRLENSSLPIRTASPRTIYYKNDASLFFGGESIRQRRMIGIDFQKEYKEMLKLEFLDGSIETLLEKDDSRGILISEVAAEILGARIGDDVILFLTTQTGQSNSANLIVRGIFRETSLFGYVAYMNQRDLNLLQLRDPGSATDIAVYARKGSDINKLLIQIRDLLSETSTVLPPMITKEDLYRELSELEDPSVPALAPLTLEAHLDQIKTIIDAVKIVTWFIQVLFMLIIMVGILNTYRVLVYERTKEIGMLRAMGMTRKEVRSMFLLEAFFLDLAASISGLFFFVVIVKILACVDISELPGAGLFTESGHLSPLLNLSVITLTFSLMLAAVLIAAWGPAERASRLSPVDAMREVN